MRSRGEQYGIVFPLASDECRLLSTSLEFNVQDTLASEAADEPRLPAIKRLRPDLSVTLVGDNHIGQALRR